MPGAVVHLCNHGLRQLQLVPRCWLTGNLMNHISIQYAVVCPFGMKGFVRSDLQSVGRQGLA